MERIENVDLKDVVEKASQQIISQRYELAVDSIKKLIQRIVGLQEEKKKLSNNLNSVEGKIKKAQEKIDRIKADDWAVLDEKEEQQPSAPEKTS